MFPSCKYCLYDGSQDVTLSQSLFSWGLPTQCGVWGVGVDGVCVVLCVLCVLFVVWCEVFVLWCGVCVGCVQYVCGVWCVGAGVCVLCSVVSLL